MSPSTPMPPLPSCPIRVLERWATFWVKQGGRLMIRHQGEDWKHLRAKAWAACWQEMDLSPELWEGVKLAVIAPPRTGEVPRA